jgi:hypothetical protein
LVAARPNVCLPHSVILGGVAFKTRPFDGLDICAFFETLYEEVTAFVMACLCSWMCQLDVAKLIDFETKQGPFSERIKF